MAENLRTIYHNRTIRLGLKRGLPNFKPTTGCNHTFLKGQPPFQIEPSPNTESVQARLAQRTLLQFRSCVAVLALLSIALGGFSLQAQDLEVDRVQSWEFQRSDLNPSDQWPKGWKRRQDREHPAYLTMKVVPRNPDAVAAAKTLSQLWTMLESGKLNSKSNPELPPQQVTKLMDAVVDRCFELQMDGGSAEVIGPIVRLDPRYSYGLEASVQCIQLNGHEARVELELLDGNSKPISSSTTEIVTGTTRWKRIQCFSSLEDQPDFRAARVRLIVKRNDNREFRGAVRFDNIRINRVPRLELQSNLKLNIANPGQECEITCTAIGINNKDENPSVRFQLLNELGQVVEQQSVPLLPVVEPRNPSSSSGDSQQYVSMKSGSRRPSVSDHSNGQAKWKLQLNTPGHFVARVFLGKHASRIRDKELPVAVVGATPLENQGPFGWSLPPGLDNDQLRNIPQLARTFGASNIKIPIWLDVNEDAAAIDQIAWLIERLQSQQVQCVGVIDQPPASQRKQFNDNDDRLPIVTIFQNKAIWEPLLDPILSRMTMKLSWFQLGNDDDHSFLANEKLIQTLAEIHSSVQTYSQELHLAIAWPWLDGLPQGQPMAWEATQLSIDPDLRSEELPSYVASKAHEGTTKWLTLDFLAASKYSLLDRVRDLTERVVTMKKLGVSAAYVTKPMDPDVGLFNSSFEPQVISVPWRTLVEHVGSALYVGKIMLPGGSQNHIFQNGKYGLMVVWNDNSKEEQLYLGPEVDAVDLWGRPVTVESAKSPRNGAEQRFAVGPWPIIIRGLDLPVARFRMQFELGTASLQSLVGRGQAVPIKVGNPFGKVIRGSMDLVAPTLLERDYASLSLQVTPDRVLEKDFPLELRSDVSAGKHAVRFDFQIEADKTERFSTYHELTVGFDDIEFQWQLQKVSDTSVLLRLTANNRSNLETTFQCKFFPPPYPYQHLQAENLTPGINNREYLIQLPNVDESAEFWIRCEELETRRTLNYRVKIDRVASKK
jgi:hypothetical protein